MSAVAARPSGPDPFADIQRRLDPRSMRADALRELNDMFKSSSVPEPPPNGFLAGRLITMSMARPVDALVRSAARLYMPWLGKRFDATSKTGTNVLRSNARSQIKVLWPSYVPTDTGDNLEAFSFRTRLAPGELDPDTTVLKIDYDFEENPSFLIRHILDELVRISDGVYLGKILYRAGGSWRPIGFFSLTA